MLAKVRPPHARYTAAILSILLGLLLNSCSPVGPIQPTAQNSPLNRTAAPKPTLSPTDRAVRETQRAFATQAYYARNPATTAELLAVLQSGNQNARVEAIKSLQSRQELEVVKALIMTLKDGDLVVQQAAGEALVRIGPLAVEPLIAALHDPNPTIQNWAAGDLGKLNDRRAVEPLLAVLADNTSPAQASAAVALGDLRDPRAVDPLVAFLQQTTTAYNQELAVHALRNIGDPRAVDPLIAFVANGGSGYACYFAVEALGYFKDPSAIEPILTAARVRTCNVNAQFLAAFGEAAIAPLIAALKKDDWQVRDLAVDALIAIGEPAVEPMLAVLDPPDVEVIANAYRYYVALGHPGTEPALAVALEKNGTKEMATCFLNSGNETLSKAGMAWAKANGYTVLSSGSSTVTTSWGSLKN